MSRKKIITLTVYTVLFYTAWAVFELICKDHLNNLVHNEAARQLIRSGVIKNIIWTLPAALLIHHFKSEVKIPLKEMFTSKIDWLRYLPIFLLFTIYLVGGSLARNKGFHISDKFGAGDIIVVIFVGLSEEIVFRGWLLNATLSDRSDNFDDKQILPVAVNTVMFLAIHFPKWIHDGMFVSSFTQFGFISIMALSVIFSYTFVKSRNLIVPILLHMYWDLLVPMFAQ